MPKKVFELAKEVGIASLELVDKIKEMGLDVRNHMVSLSDEDVEKVLKHLDAAEAAANPPKKKVTKKKVAKKKAATKKVVSKVTKMSGKESQGDGDEDEVPKVKKVIVKRKVVKKASKAEAPAEPVEDNVETAAAEQETIQAESLASSEVADVSVTPATPVEAVAESSEKAKTDGMYKEKMHTFTPVFVPEKKPEAKAAPAKPASTPRTSPSFSSPDLPGKADAGKKRMGDLAAMVSKKGASSKPQDITNIRAQEGMKLASTVMARQIYTPIARKKVFMGQTQKTEVTTVKDAKRVIGIHDVTTAEELAQSLSQRFDKFKNMLLSLNILVAPSDYIGMKLASEIAALYDYRVENTAFDETAVLGLEVKEDKSSLPLRNPIITVMGHVDHGKTTLLDTIRSAKVTDGEAGGITQHIGAYSVKVADSTITFLDTPGHAAFGSMRQRGANVTDIVVLVVAADDGVMPQTKESIRYAKNANCPIIVAVNKMDKEGANPERIKQELTEFELVSEDWGGDTMYVPVSALKGEGIDTLLENIKLQAEIMDLREDPKGTTQGVIIEAKVEAGRGSVATVLVQKGTLKKGDCVVVGECYGRARSLTDSSGKEVQSAGPSIPVQILGLNSVPSPGDSLNVAKNEREAKKIAENRIDERKKLETAEAPRVNSLEDFFGNIDGDAEEKKILNLVVRSDVQGSYEAIKDALNALGNDEVGVNIITGGVGAITDNDVNMASNTDGFIIGFNMRPVTSARKLAEQQGVDVRTYSIIYELINDVTLALEGMLEPESVEKYIGRAEVRDIFSIPKIGTVAGSAVIDGKIERGCNIRLLRAGKIIYDGKLSTLKRFKDEVKEVSNGFECGMALEGFNDIKSSDLIEAYVLEKKERKLEAVEI